MKKSYILLINLFIYFFFISITSSTAQELTPEQIYEKTNDCVVVILSYDFNGKLLKQGSGVVLSDKGWIVTNYHVFAECEKMEVKHNDKIIKYTDIIGVDVEKDILILKIEDNTFPPIPIGISDNLKVGQRVYTIGSPLGFENSMSEGIISGIRNIDEKNKNYIQVTASISPGSSGGAVVNNKGELIGISTSTFKEGQNLNFAIPVNDVMLVSIGSYNDKKHIEASNYFYKGFNASKSKNYEGAIKYYTKSIEVNPNYPSVYYNRGLAYYKLQEYSNAISDYTKALEIKPEFADAFNSRGNAYSAMKEFRKAIIDFNKAIELKPDFVFAYVNRGEAYTDLLELSKAISDYSKAIEIDPDFEGAYLSRGNAYSDLKDYNNAILDYTKAIELNTNFAEAYYNRANSYSDLKDYSKAISDYNKTIILNPNDKEAYFNRGNAYFNLGDKKNACEDWRRAYSLGEMDAKELILKICK